MVGGKFRVDRILAEGGMGVVVAATHLKLDQPVAMKFVRGEFGANAEALGRLDREAKAAAQLKSEHVARVLDVGVTDDGSPYMVMEYLEGLNLLDVIEVMGPLDVDSAAEYTIQACEGLAEAHARGIVHRDIKPDNLFLVERSGGWRAIKILDFGISKIRLTNAQNVATGIIMGSPCYMSPEQLRSTATVDHRTDIWSLGATLHELLTGKQAFDPALSLPELVQAIMHEPATSVHQLRPEVPEALAAIVDRCLAKDRDARFDSAADLARALLPFAPARASSLVDRAASMLPAFPVSSAPVSSVPSVDERRQPTERPTVVAVDTNVQASPSTSASPKRSMRRMLIISGVWSAGAVLTFALLMSLRTSAPRAQPSVEVAPPPLPAPEPVKPPESIGLVVRVSPATAQITIDGEPVKGNPFEARYPKDDQARRIAATAPGFEPKWDDVPFSRDAVVNLELSRRSSPPPTARAAVSDSAPRTAAGSASALPASPRPPKRPVPPAPSVADGPSFTPTEVTSSGGRAPLRPIDTKNPFLSP